jgi:hypothetical protein
MAVHFKKSKPAKIAVLDLTVIPALKKNKIETTLYRPSRLG